MYDVICLLITTCYLNSLLSLLAADDLQPCKPMLNQSVIVSRTHQISFVLRLGHLIKDHYQFYLLLTHVSHRNQEHAIISSKPCV